MRIGGGKRISIHFTRRADTKVRPYNNSLTLALSRGERGKVVWGAMGYALIHPTFSIPS